MDNTKTQVDVEIDKIIEKLLEARGQKTTKNSNLTES